MKTMNLTLMLLLFAVLTYAQNVPSYVPTNGLVGWWPFNGNANDESGNSLNLSNNLVSFSTDRNGIVNAAGSFDGNSSYLRIDTFAALKPNSFTISCWFLRITQGSPGTILALSPPTWQWSTPYKVFFGDFMGNIVLDSRIWTPIVQWQDINSDSLGNQLNTWYNAIMTYDSATQLHKFYVDNTLVGSRQSQLDYTFPLEGFYIGTTRESLTGSLSEFFSGKIDDIGIWNRALDSTEIAAIYNSSTNTANIQNNHNNQITIYPNPSNDQITIDAGDLNVMDGYSIRISNSLGQQMFQSAITQQQFYIDLSTWTGNGIYFVNIIDPTGKIIDVKKIVLQ